ncbi:MAG: fibronectin type III domain-containing protein, partial [Candidatus Thermoplasmatota archaeon]|nr:fibronectin type III domain-containing protein [Candidatus Thermoplasmatota archaeon]
GVDLLDSGLVSNYESGEIIGSTFSLRDNLYGFDLAPYDRSRKVVIDPEYNVNALNFSTYIGGSSSEVPYEMDLDDNGNIVICGATSSTDFPVTVDAYQDYLNGGTDAFVLKMDRNGKNIIFCTYLGGIDDDIAESVKVDRNDNCYVAGITSSDDFPVTTDAFSETNKGSGELFIIRMNGAGNVLDYSTYIGGSENERNPRIDIDIEGMVYLAAITTSSDFPITSDAYQNTMITEGGGSDIVFLKMDLSTMDLVYSSFIGGKWSDESYCIKYDGNGCIFIAGRSDFINATPGAYQQSSNHEDSFVLKFDMLGNDIVYCTFFGGTGTEVIFDIDIDSYGNLYACGFTDSFDFPVTPGAYDISLGGSRDGFVMCLNPAGSALVFSSYVGGNGSERFESIALDNMGDIHVSGGLYGGWTTPVFDFPVTEGGFQEVAGGGWEEVIYLKLSGDGKKNLYSTYLGGSDMDKFNDLLVDPSNGEVIILGYTDSDDFPIKDGSYDTSINGYGDIFVSKLNLSIRPEKPGLPNVVNGDSFVNLSWDPPAIDGGAPVTDYEVHRGTKSGSLTRIAFTGGNNSYNDTSVTNGIKYYYAVLAVNRMGQGMLSDEISALPATFPTPPRNVVAKFSNRFVNLTWIAPEDDGGLVLQGFRLYKFSGSSQTPEVFTIEPYIKTYSDEAVTNGFNYRYYLTAFNAIGESLPSIEVNATPRTRPGMVEDVIISTGPEFVSLRWSAPEWDGGSPILNYTIFRAVQSGTFARYVTLPPLPRIFNDTGLENGLRYRYKLIALNSEGSGDPTDEVSAVPLDRPSPPTNFDVEAFSNSIKITWGQPLRDGGTPVLGFNIYRAEKSMIWSNIRELDALDVSYTDNSVINGRTYTYRMTALNAVGESEHTEEINVTPLGRPGSPMGYNIEAGDRFVLLSWETPLDHGGTPVTGFKVFRGESSQEMGLYATIEGPEHTYNDTKVKNGLTYYYKVAATNAVGDGPFTEAKSARPAGIPSPPSNVQVTPGDGFIDISWTSPEDDGGDPVTEVRIYRGLYDNRSSILFKGTLLEGSYKDTDVINGIFYHYSMTAVNKNGESISTHPLSVVPSGLPSVPGNVQIEEGRGHITLSWDPPSNSGGIPLTGYNIYRTSMTNGSVLIGSVNANILEYVDEDIQTGAIYLYRVSALNDNGEGPLSDPVEGIMKEETGSYTTIIVAISILIIIILTLVILIIMMVKKRGSSQQTPDAPSPPIPSAIRDPHGEEGIPPPEGGS